MRAIVVHGTGGPEALVLEDVPDPVPGSGDLLVEVETAGINFIDTYHRGGLYPMATPFTPGLEGAGVVVAKGEGISDFAVGDRVGWTDVLGSYAERHVIPEEKAVAIPVGIKEREAAAVLLQGITSHYLVTSTYPVSPADVCLIHAGAGGVGLLLTQMVKGAGAKAITTVGSDEKMELSRDAGADFVVNYTTDDFEEAIVDHFGERPISVVFDGVGGATFDKGLRLLRPRGMMVTFGNASGPVDAVSPLELMRQGSLFLTRPTMMDYISTTEELRTRANDVLGQLANGRLHLHIGGEYPLARAGDAHEALEARQTTGKILLIP